jgi:import inner membrane translocase subunit TIM17
MDAHEREPCPHRIIDDLGGAFAFGAVGGTMFHSFKGARNAPRGERFAGAVEAVKANARRLGGSFAVWGGLFSTFDCCFIAVRNKEDPYNSIMSGFCTGAALASRGGASAAMKAGVVGGIILAVIEGLNIGITRMFSQMDMAPPEEPIQMQAAGAGGEAQAQEAAQQPWWAKLAAPLLPAPPPPEVDFSDPKEMGAAPVMTDKWAKSPLEPRIDVQQLFLLLRRDATHPAAIVDWRSRFMLHPDRS